jgi:hypothetical protein
MSVSKVIQLSPLLTKRKQRVSSRKRVFYLGTHSYSGAPGLSWTTQYWVKRLGKGESWELRCSDEESPRSKLYAGTYTPDELRDYFDSVGFYIDDRRWAFIGLGRTADVVSILGEADE